MVGVNSIKQEDPLINKQNYSKTQMILSDGSCCNRSCEEAVLGTSLKFGVTFWGTSSPSKEQLVRINIEPQNAQISKI